MVPTLYDSDGNSVALGKMLGQGGEGAVYEVPLRADLVAKLYHQRIDGLKAAKIIAMGEVARPELLKIAAWPVQTLSTARGGSVVGFLMPRISDHREAHNLYGPKQRRAEFPRADWKFLIWAARNAAAAVQAVHAAGHVIGDINQKNFMVARNATVCLIDCDSFQISSNGRKYPCLVGVPEFTPPELHGKSFERIEREPNHDGFGLAVLIFHFLFMGRHPFAGRFQGTGDMPPERAIRELRFAYSQTAATRQMIPPPHSLALSAGSFNIASLFERAFGSRGTHGYRPTADEWRIALGALANELSACSVDAGHKYHNSLSECPWCQIEKGGGPAFFITFVPSINTAAGGVFDIGRVWAAIASVPMPPEVPKAPPTLVLPKVTPKPIPQSVVKRRRVSLVGFILAGIALALFLSSLVPEGVGLLLTLGFGIAAIVFRRNPDWTVERARRKTALESAELQWKRLIDAWQKDAKVAVDTFTSKRRELEKFASEYRQLPQLHRKEHEILNRRREELQRQAFLGSHYLRQAQIVGIGHGLKATLISFGFETAGDISAPVMQVPGIGAGRYASLMAWRQSVEAKFRFNAHQSVSPADVAAVDHKFALRQKELERLLLQGKPELEHLRRRAEQISATPAARFAPAAQQLTQARADSRAV